MERSLFLSRALDIDLCFAVSALLRCANNILAQVADAYGGMRPDVRTDRN
jgi:hypothetical protein